MANKSHPVFVPQVPGTRGPHQPHGRGREHGLRSENHAVPNGVDCFLTMTESIGKQQLLSAEPPWVRLSNAFEYRSMHYARPRFPKWRALSNRFSSIFLVPVAAPRQWDVKPPADES